MTQPPLPDLPKGWRWIDAGQLIEQITAGKSFKCEERPPQDGEIGVVKVSAVTWGTYNEQESKTCTREELVKPELFIRPGDFLFSRANTIELVGACVIVDRVTRNVMLSDKILRFSVRKGWARWLLWALRSNHGRAEIERLATGNQESMRNIGQERVLSVRIPLPVDGEQCRIVDAIESYLSRIDGVLTTLEHLERDLKSYRASLLKAAIKGRLVPGEAALAQQEGRDYESASRLLSRIEAPPRPNRWNSRSKDVALGHAALALGNPKSALPSGWAWSPLANIARMESGHTPSRAHPEWWDGDIPWIGIADAREHDGRIINDPARCTNSAGLANSAARLLPAGTVCISRTASVGYVVVMGRPMATSQDFVNWIPTAAVTSDWLRLVFSADREALRRFGKGSVHKTIYFPEWLSIHIAVPPLAEQERIVSEVDRLLSVTDRIAAQVRVGLRRCNQLRQAVLKCAFEGKLAIRDLSFEPASGLSERIKVDREASEPAETPLQHRSTKRQVRI